MTEQHAVRRRAAIAHAANAPLYHMFESLAKTVEADILAQPLKVRQVQERQVRVALDDLFIVVAVVHRKVQPLPHQGEGNFVPRKTRNLPKPEDDWHRQTLQQDTPQRLRCDFGQKRPVLIVHF